MAGNNGPKIVTNGLILALDAADKKSYPGSGTSWFDISGNNFVGTLSTANYSPGQGAPSFVSTYGGGFYFNGYSGQYVDTNLTNATLNVNTGDFTMEVWADFYSINSGNQKALAYMGNINVYSPNYYSAQIWYSLQANLYAEFRNASSSSANITVNFSYGVNHFVYVRNGGTFYAYKNGVSSGSATYTNNSVNSAAKFTLGSSMNGFSDLFYGNIYNCKVYNRALSAAEVLRNFNAQRGRFGI